MGSQVPAFGTDNSIIGKPSSGGDPIAAMRADLDALAARLAPEPMMLQARFNSVAALGIVTVRPTGPFNSFLNCLTAGTVDVFFGPQPTGLPDIVLTGGSNPILVPFASRNDVVICFQVDVSTLSDALGMIYTMDY
jgi:hypothetical protein